MLNAGGMSPSQISSTTYVPSLRRNMDPMALPFDPQSYYGGFSEPQAAPAASPIPSGPLPYAWPNAAPPQGFQPPQAPPPMVTVIPIVLKSPGTAAPTDTATISSPATPAKAKPAPASIIEEDGLDAPVSNRAKSKTTTTTSELDDVSETDSTTSTSKTASTRSSRTRDYPDGVRTEADKFADDIADAVRDGVFKLVQDDPALMKTLRDKWQENQDFFKNPGENFEEIHRTFQRRYKRSRFVRFMFNNFFENRFVNFFPAGFQGPIRDVIDWLKKPTSSYSSRYDF